MITSIVVLVFLGAAGKPNSARVLGLVGRFRSMLGRTSFRPFDAVAGMTLTAMVMVRHDLYWTVVSLVAAALAISPRIRCNGWFWLGIAASLTPPLLADWQLFEDHVFFAVYWCAAIGISRFGSGKRSGLASAARHMIGWVMLFAVIWKAISGQYLSGEMFHHHLLIDGRFRTVICETIGGLDPTTEANLRGELTRLEASDRPMAVPVESTPMIAWIAAWMTGWTIYIEAIMAICFLCPPGKRGHAGLRKISRARNPVLLGFMLSTYAVVPVVGFGLLFSAMGLAQTKPDERIWRSGYLLFAVGLMMYSSFYDWMLVV